MRFESLEDRRMLAAGTLDPTFSSDGRLTTGFAASGDYGYSVAVQSDGKIVVAGRTDSGPSNSDFALARYNSNGTLDTSFDGDGKLTTAIGPSYDTAYSVALQSDGKIVVSGSSSGSGSNDDFALARYNSDGTLDTSFDGDGKLTTAFVGASVDRGYSVAVQSDGKIIVAGRSTGDFALARYNSNGTLDTSFDGDGKLTTDLGSPIDDGLSLAVQSDGKIVVAGYSDNITNADFAIARYNADGTLDTSFSSDGKLTTDFGSRFDFGRSVAVQSDGKIVVAGNTDSDFALARYNANGTLDTSFDSDGLLTTDFGGSGDTGTSVVVQSNGKIIVAGESRSGTNTDFAVARYNANGALDTSFDGDGRLTTAFGAFDDYGSRVVVQSDGKIVVAGASYNGVDEDFAVARYEGDSIQPALLGDYNLNNVVDAADYIVWRKSLNRTGVTPYYGADGSGNGSIGQEDLAVWRARFGNTAPPAAGSGAGEESSVAGIVSNAEAAVAPVETEATAARTANFAALETQSLWHDSSSRSRAKVNRYSVGVSSGDDLHLFLAIDRVGRTIRQVSLANDDNGNDEYRADDDSESEINEPLGVAFAVW